MGNFCSWEQKFLLIKNTLKEKKKLELGSNLLKPPTGQRRLMVVSSVKLASNQRLEQTAFNIKKKCKYTEIVLQIQRQDHYFLMFQFLQSLLSVYNMRSRSALQNLHSCYSTVEHRTQSKENMYRTADEEFNDSRCESSHVGLLGNQPYMVTFK